MSKVKRILSVIMAMVMVLAMSVPTFAETRKPVETDAAAVTISNVENGATITAYQIIDASYGANGFLGYVWAKGMTNADQTVSNPMTAVTSDMITALAKNPAGLEKVSNVVSDQTQLTVGTWMLIVTPPSTNPEKVYNPMVVSVYYNVDKSGDDNTAIGGAVSAKEKWTLATTNAYAKSTEIKLTKTVKSEDKLAEVGESVDFTISGTIPSYSAEYTTPKYILKDTIVNGLEYPENMAPTVKVGGSAVDASNYKFTLAGNKKSFTVEFTSQYILSLANATEEQRAVTVDYSANITAEAITHVAENRADLNYTTKPDEEKDATPSSAYVATFSLDNVIEKVKEDSTALDKAEFTLYRDEELTDKFDSYTTETDGDIQFKGLAGDQVYYLKETKAPDGYSLNDTVYKIEFTDITYDAKNEKVVSYNVKITNMTTNQEVNGAIHYGSPATDFATTVVNTKISSLPSTGGIGTTIFTIGGCAIMIVAAGLFFATRRKTQK